MSDNPNYYFLKTENYEPLYLLLDKLTAKINENHAIVERLANTVDVTLTADDDANLPLRHLLESKYRLSTVKTDTFEDVSNPVMRALLVDIARLQKVKAANSYKNSELYKVYQEYETNIVTVIIPSLKSEIYAFNREQHLQTLDHLDKKEALTSDLWLRYNVYVEHLRRLEELSHKVLGCLSVEGRDGTRVMEKLMVLQSILHYMGGSTD